MKLTIPQKDLLLSILLACSLYIATIKAFDFMSNQAAAILFFVFGIITTILFIKFFPKTSLDKSNMVIGRAGAGRGYKITDLLNYSWNEFGIDKNDLYQELSFLKQKYGEKKIQLALIEGYHTMPIKDRVNYQHFISLW